MRDPVAMSTGYRIKSGHSPPSMAQDRGQKSKRRVLGPHCHRGGEHSNGCTAMDGMELAAQHCIGQLIVPDSAAAPSMLRRAASS
jgi:hypothetical protein